MTTSSRPQKLQGPIRAVDVLDALVDEDRRCRDRAMDAGQWETDAYYQAWQWLVAVILDHPRPELPWHAQQALIRVQQGGYRLESGR